MAEGNPSPKVTKVDLSQPVTVEGDRVCYLLQPIPQEAGPPKLFTVFYFDGRYGNVGSYSTDRGGDGYLFDVPPECTPQQLLGLWEAYLASLPPGGDTPGTVSGKPPP